MRSLRLQLSVGSAIGYVYEHILSAGLFIQLFSQIFFGYVICSNVCMLPSLLRIIAWSERDQWTSLQDAHVTACLTGMDMDACCSGCRTTHFILQKEKVWCTSGAKNEPTLGRRRPLTNCARKKAANYVLREGGLEGKSPSIINPISTWSRPTHRSSNREGFVFIIIGLPKNLFVCYYCRAHILASSIWYVRSNLSRA